MVAYGDGDGNRDGDGEGNNSTAGTGNGLTWGFGLISLLRRICQPPPRAR